MRAGAAPHLPASRARANPVLASGDPTLIPPLFAPPGPLPVRSSAPPQQETSWSRPNNRINGLTLRRHVAVLIAIGCTMVYGIIGMINFAHGDIFMVSAFIAVTAFPSLAAADVTDPAAL